MNTLAQEIIMNNSQGTPYTVRGPLDPTKFNSLASVLNVVLKAIFPVALFILFVYLLWAGFDMARSWNSPELIKKAKARITNSIIGIILLALSYWLAQIATKIFFG